MSKLKTLFKNFGETFEIYGRLRVRQELLAMSNRQLADLGYSRALLESGLEAWPWRLESETSTKLSTISNTAQDAEVEIPVEHKTAA